MLKKLIILVVFVFMSMPVFAQSVDTAWVRRYNGLGDSTDCVKGLAIDDSGRIYVTGYSYGGMTYRDYITIKYEPNGDTAWVSRYNGPGLDIDLAHAIAVDDFGYAYVTGWSAGSGTGEDYTTIKYYSDGDTAWVRRYDGPGHYNDYANAIAVDNSGNIYITGYSYNSTWDFDYVTVKYYPNGDTAWARRCDKNLRDLAQAVAVDDFGNVYVTGASGTLSDQDYLTIKYDSLGNQLWIMNYNGPINSIDQAFAIALDSSGNIYVTGRSVGSGTGYDYVTVKYYPNGDTAWLRRYDGPGNSVDSAGAIALDASDNIYVTGKSYGNGTDFDYATVKYDSSGIEIWVRRYNGPGDGEDGACAIAVDGFGNVYVTGYSYGSGTDLDYATIKYKPNGDTAWVKRYNGLGNGDDYTAGIVIDSSGNVYVTGYSKGSATDYDYATMKYIQFVRGDGNGDGHVGIGDVIFLINYLFRGGPASDPIQSGDVNCDGQVSIGDIIYLINYLFRGCPPPCI